MEIPQVIGIIMILLTLSSVFVFRIVPMYLIYKAFRKLFR